MATKNEKKISKATPYECIRCGYTTIEKSYMRRHLFSLKKVCASKKTDIELTDDIKNNILINKIYKIAKEEKSKKIIDEETWVKYKETSWICVLELEEKNKYKMIDDYEKKGIKQLGKNGIEKVKDYMKDNLSYEEGGYRNIEIINFNKYTEEGYLILEITYEADKYSRGISIFNIWADTGGEGTITVNKREYLVEPIEKEIKLV